MNLKKKLIAGSTGLVLIASGFTAGTLLKPEPLMTINYSIPQDSNEKSGIYYPRKTSVTVKASEVNNYIIKNGSYMQDISISIPSQR